MRIKFASAIALATLIIAAPSPLLAQDAPTAAAEKVEAPAAVTANPALKLDHLSLLLDPLTKEELLVEATAWRDLLKANVQQIAEQEIATRDKNKEIADADAEPAPSGVAEEAVKEEEKEEKQEEKQETLDTLVELRNQKDGLLERFEAVLAAYEKKGGDPTEFRQYASAVSGLKVEITDVNATWAAVQGWLTSENGGIKWLFKALLFFAILLVFWIIAGILGKVVRKATGLRRVQGQSALLTTFINHMVRRTVLLIGLITALSAVGVNVGALLALVGGGAFIIGFALQDTLGNFAAGVMLLIYRPFDVGDAVEVGGISGKVDKVSLVSTIIRTPDNKVVLVPNKQVWGQVITNSTASAERRVDMIFGIGYGDDVDRAKEILERILAEHELVLDEPAPTVQLNELGASSVNFICRPWVKTADYWTVYWDVTKQVKKEFDANGISIPFPQQDVYLHRVEA